MRVTNNMFQQSLLRDIGSSMTGFLAAQSQVSSGKRVTKASDDPVATSEMLAVSAERAGIAQYKRNIVSARYRLQTEETVLNQVGDILLAARDIGMAEGSDNRNAETRAASKPVVDHSLAQIIALGNTRSGSEYIFGGQVTRTPPFAADGSYSGDTNAWNVEINKGYNFLPNETGQTLLVDTGVIKGLKDLSTALAANDQPAIATATTNLKAAYDAIQAHLTNNGGRSTQLDAEEQVHGDRDEYLSERNSDLGDVDMAEAMVRFSTKQNALQAALQATGKALNLSLTDYLR